MASSATGSLLAGGGQHVEFAAVGVAGFGGRQFLGQAQQAVGFAAHGAGDDDHLVAGPRPLGHALGDVADALGRAHRRAAVFVNDQCHAGCQSGSCCGFFAGGCGKKRCFGGRRGAPAKPNYT
jgi:hypothetical protein